MKKALIIVLLTLLANFGAHAQVTFRPGIRGGLNFSHFTDQNKQNTGYTNAFYYNANGDFTPGTYKLTSKTDFYVAFYGALKLSRFYTLQPEIDYSNQGGYMEGSDGSKTKLNVSYLSFPIINKFTFGDKFNIHFGPTVDFVVDKNFDVDTDVDFGFTLGAGYNFTKNFGVEARVKKGLLSVFETGNNSSSHTNVVFQTGITYTFDVK